MSTEISGVGLRLIELRKKNGLTQPIMAAKLKVADRTYKSYELEQRDMPVKVAARICEVFNVSLDWLLFGKSGASGLDLGALKETAYAVLRAIHERELDWPDEKVAGLIAYIQLQSAKAGHDPNKAVEQYFEIL